MGAVPATHRAHPGGPAVGMRPPWPARLVRVPAVMALGLMLAALGGAHAQAQVQDLAGAGRLPKVSTAREVPPPADWDAPLLPMVPAPAPVKPQAVPRRPPTTTQVGRKALASRVNRATHAEGRAPRAAVAAVALRAKAAPAARKLPRAAGAPARKAVAAHAGRQAPRSQQGRAPGHQGAAAKPGARGHRAPLPGR